VLAVAAFVVLAKEVIAGRTADFDLTVITALRTTGDLSDPLGPPWVEEFARDVTALGSFAFLGFLVAATIGYLLLMRQAALAAWVVMAELGGVILSTALKYAIDRPRPDLPHVARVFTPGFPSGHATLSALTFLTLGLLLTRATEERRVRSYLVALAAVLTVAVGFSRMYLGVHYPSDVVAGWCIGGGWALLCWAIATVLQRQRAIPSPGA
jgi:undecaprenyl-diphosphatase